jgi:hypothetical protein
MKSISTLIAAAIVVCGCASITDGTTQTIIIPVTPREASCSVMRNDVELGTITGTQQTITVSKGARDILLHCKAPGYLPKVARLVSTTQTEGMMSFLFLDLGITDMVTGAMWKYPQSSSIVMERDPAVPVPPTAAVAMGGTAGVTSGTTVERNRMNEVSAPPPPPPKATGKDSFQAERFAKSVGCIKDTTATLIGKGPGYESYSFQCLNEEVLVVRCEYGNCRALK